MSAVRTELELLQRDVVASPATLEVQADAPPRLSDGQLGDERELEELRYRLAAAEQ